jgi:hypothetical protein
MTIELVSEGWETILHGAASADRSRLRIACPFIKRGALERLLAAGPPEQIDVITRFDLRAFADRVSDLSALHLLLQHGARVRGVLGLHTKLYLVGAANAIVTSANLTNAGLRSNHELGFSIRDTDLVRRCEAYFGQLWERAGNDLVPERLAAWEEKVEAYLLAGAPPVAAGVLADEGVVAGLAEPAGNAAWSTTAGQAFVKFFGRANEREHPSAGVAEVLQRTGAHWACTYPAGRRPRAVCDGDTIYLSRMTRDGAGDDIIVFGRALAFRHVEGRDDATAEDIALRPWRRRWPHYVRVHHGAFVDGVLANGVSLYELMDDLRAETFATTLANVAAGSGNTNPRRAYRQQPAARLSPRGRAVLDARLEEAFARHGRLPAAELARLDWPADHRMFATG